MIDEILVHISAPTTRQHDDLYRSLADAYVKFEPCRPNSGSSDLRADEQTAPSNSSQKNSAASTREILNEIPGNTSIWSASKESYGSFPSYLSSEDHEHHVFDRHDTKAIPGSTPSSSRLARLEHIHKQWKGQATPKSSFVNGMKGKESLPSSDDPDTAFIEDTQMGIQALQSQLYDSYALASEDTTGENDESMNLTLQAHTSTTNKFPESGSPNLLDLTSVHLSNVKIQSVNSNGQIKSHSDDTLHVDPISSDGKNDHECAIVPSNTLEPSSLARLPFDAFPPAAKVSIAQPGALPTQITKHLAAIKAQSPLRFKPSVKLRNPELDERGYWLVSCLQWPTKLQLEFWSTLSEHVKSGRLGWGTTLHRTPQSPTTLGQVQLYCWGEVVEHMWLLLWLCSQGKISSAPSRWYDADGVLVFEVV